MVREIDCSQPDYSVNGKEYFLVVSETLPEGEVLIAQTRSLKKRQTSSDVGRFFAC